MAAQQVVSCAVRWAAVSPLATDRRDHSLTLTGDADGNPDSLFLFGGGVTSTEISSQLVGTLNLTVNMVWILIYLSAQVEHGNRANQKGLKLRSPNLEYDD